MRNKAQKKAWRKQIIAMFPDSRERMRQQIKSIDNRIPKPSKNNEWRTLSKLAQTN